MFCPPLNLWEKGGGGMLTGVGFWGSPCAPSSVSGIRTPKLPLLPLWEKGVGGMRGKRRGNAANRALLLRTLPLRGGGMRGRRKRRQGATNTPGESEPSHVPCAGWSAALLPHVHPLHMQCAAFVNLDATFQIYYSERGFDRFERIRCVHDRDVCHIDGDAVLA